MEDVRSLNKKFQGLQIDAKSHLEDVCQNLTSLHINKGKKRLVGSDVQEDENYYVMTCTGVDATKDMFIKIRVKRNKPN